MTKGFGTVGLLVLALAAAPASAGVVVTQRRTVTKGVQHQTSEQTLMIQGNKERTDTGGRSVITDLDKGVMLILVPSSRNYLEMKFPPTGPLASMMATKGSSTVKWERTGIRRTVAGYPCEEYRGFGKGILGEFTITECVSRVAPGAAEFSAFQRHKARALKGSLANAAEVVPEGVPLQSDITMKAGKVSIPGLKPEQTERLNRMLAKHRPMKSRIKVIKIVEKKLSPDTFEVPAGYTRRKINMPKVPQGRPATQPAP